MLLENIREYHLGMVISAIRQAKVLGSSGLHDAQHVCLKASLFHTDCVKCLNETIGDDMDNVPKSLLEAYYNLTSEN